MALVNGITKRAEVPHEPGEFFTFRRLSWRQLQLAADIQTEALFKRIKSMGGDVLKAVQDVAVPDASLQAAAKYDRSVVLRCGIVDWTYDAEVNEENIDQLDEETAEWAFQEILALNAPRTDDDRKNGSSPSTKP